MRDGAKFVIKDYLRTLFLYLHGLKVKSPNESLMLIAPDRS